MKKYIFALMITTALCSSSPLWAMQDPDGLHVPQRAAGSPAGNLLEGPGEAPQEAVVLSDSLWATGDNPHGLPIPRRGAASPAVPLGAASPPVPLGAAALRSGAVDSNNDSDVSGPITFFNGDFPQASISINSFSSGTRSGNSGLAGALDQLVIMGGGNSIPLALQPSPGFPASAAVAQNVEEEEAEAEAEADDALPALARAPEPLKRTLSSGPAAPKAVAAPLPSRSLSTPNS